MAGGAHHPGSHGDLSAWRPKSNAAYLAIDEALRDVREGEAQVVPDHLRDRHRPGADEYPAYRYPHDFPGARVEQQYLPDGLAGTRYYRPEGAASEDDEAGTDDPVDRF